MTAATPTRANAVRPKAPARLEKPAQRLWKTDKAKAFDAGVRWFLAISRNA